MSKLKPLSFSWFTASHFITVLAYGAAGIGFSFLVAGLGSTVLQVRMVKRLCAKQARLFSVAMPVSDSCSFPGAPA